MERPTLSPTAERLTPEAKAQLKSFVAAAWANGMPVSHEEQDDLLRAVDAALDDKVRQNRSLDVIQGRLSLLWLQFDALLRRKYADTRAAEAQVLPLRPAV